MKSSWICVPARRSTHARLANARANAGFHHQWNLGSSDRHHHLASVGERRGDARKHGADVRHALVVAVDRDARQGRTGRYCRPCAGARSPRPASRIRSRAPSCPSARRRGNRALCQMPVHAEGLFRIGCDPVQRQDRTDAADERPAQGRQSVNLATLRPGCDRLAPSIIPSPFAAILVPSTERCDAKPHRAMLTPEGLKDG